MKFTSSFAIAGMVALLGASAAMAQMTPAKPAAPAAAPKPSTTAPMAGDKMAISKACSDQADAKKLHGKERKKFREECKHNAGKAAM